jgi:glucose-1-phosphate adenylyltransferase
MNDTEIGFGSNIEKAIIAENVHIGDHVTIGEGEEVENDTAPHIYNHGLVCIGEKSVIPNEISIGKNVVVAGNTSAEDYPNGKLASGKSLVKAGGEV